MAEAESAERSVELTTQLIQFDNWQKATNARPMGVLWAKVENSLQHETSNNECSTISPSKALKAFDILFM
jgi:hypothetical protein